MNETVKTDSSVKKDGMRKKKILITLVCVAAIILAGAGLGYRHLKADGSSPTKAAFFQTTEPSRDGLPALASADASSTTGNSATEKPTAATTLKAGRAKVYMSWKASTGPVSGYKIAYRRSGSRTWHHLYTTKTYMTISNLSRQRKYYFAVHAYKTIDGQKYYGTYSSARAITVK
ncbi:MAG: fibronectin type III domain-containing protein [Coriobacteriia bacterium]|nr:fibronectin type III domain-containing protein [Coriobacteriia bacterium]